MKRTWWVLLPDRVKTHFVPEEIKERLLRNFSDRGYLAPKGAPKNWVLEPVIEGGICCGGARLVNDSIMDFALPGLAFHLYAADVEYFLDVIRKVPERLELGTPYYKIHGDIHCVCLLPDDRELLIRLMEERLEEANALRDVDLTAYNEAIGHLRDSEYCDPGPERPVRTMEEV